MILLEHTREEENCTNGKEKSFLLNDGSDLQILARTTETPGSNGLLIKSRQKALPVRPKGQADATTVNDRSMVNANNTTELVGHSSSDGCMEVTTHAEMKTKESGSARERSIIESYSPRSSTQQTKDVRPINRVII